MQRYELTDGHTMQREWKRGDAKYSDDPWVLRDKNSLIIDNDMYRSDLLERNKLSVIRIVEV